VKAKKRKIRQLVCIFVLMCLFPLSACNKTRGNSWIFGKEKGRKVVRVEDHSDALLYFLKNKFKNRVVLHIDAHDDSRFVSENNIKEIKQLSSENKYALLKERSGISYGSKGKVFNIGNFLYAGFKLGVVKKVYWVFPAGKLIPESLGKVREYLRKIGFKKESAQSFRYENGFFRGVRNGLPIVLCTQKNIPDITETAVVSLDTDYLMGVYANPMKMPLGDLTKKLFDDLKRNNIRTDFVLISYSVRGMTLPLMHRYAGDYLVDLIINPKDELNMSEGIVKARDTALKMRYRAKYDDSIKYLQKLVEADGKNASIYYDLALSYLAKKDMNKTTEFLKKAIKNDPIYFLGYIEIGNILISQGIFKKEERTSIVSRFLKNSFGFLKDNVKAKSYVMLGNAMFFNGAVRKAQVQYSNALKEVVGITKYEFRN
jgi:tetratricopeptide (TPR) repeat protein